MRSPPPRVRAYLGVANISMVCLLIHSLEATCTLLVHPFIPFHYYAHSLPRLPLPPFFRLQGARRAIAAADFGENYRISNSRVLDVIEYQPGTVV